MKLKFHHFFTPLLFLSLLFLPLIVSAEKLHGASTIASSPNQTATPAVVAEAKKYTGKVFKQDIHYKKLERRVKPQASSDKIEVVEMFWYGCPHCFKLEPSVKKWKKTIPQDVEFISIPAAFNERWAIHAKAFFAAQSLGLHEATHDVLFKAIHEQGRRLNTVDALARFFASEGVDKDKFKEKMNSKEVKAKVNMAKSLGKRYGLTGVPSLIVDGQYRVLLDHIKSYGELFEIVDFLVDKVRKDRSAKG